MSDIVKRLRHPKASQDEMEAAAEIELLREKLCDRQEAVEDWRQRWRDANAKIERLRLMIGSLLDVTAGRMTDAEIKDAYGMLGYDVMRRARELR